VNVPRDAYGDGRPARSVDASRLWTGGVAAALVTLVGVLDEKAGSLLSGVARRAVRTGP
jgi:hypothetical protein